MSLTALREAFYNASQEQEQKNALKALVNAYKARKAAQEPVYRVDLVKHKPRVYVAPDNTMRINWNE